DTPRITDVKYAVRSRLAELGRNLVAIVAALVEPVDAGLQSAQRLLEALLEGAADRHHLADRLHLRGQARIGLRKLLEREAGDLRDHVVDRRLERRRRRAAGDV